MLQHVGALATLRNLDMPFVDPELPVPVINAVSSEAHALLGTPESSWKRIRWHKEARAELWQLVRDVAEKLEE